MFFCSGVRLCLVSFYVNQQINGMYEPYNVSHDRQCDCPRSQFGDNVDWQMQTIKQTPTTAGLRHFNCAHRLVANEQNQRTKQEYHILRRRISQMRIFKWLRLVRESLEWKWATEENKASRGGQVDQRIIHMRSTNGVLLERMQIFFNAIRPSNARHSSGFSQIRIGHRGTLSHIIGYQTISFNERTTRWHAWGPQPNRNVFNAKQYPLCVRAHKHTLQRTVTASFWPTKSQKPHDCELPIASKSTQCKHCASSP